MQFLMLNAVDGTLVRIGESETLKRLFPLGKCFNLPRTNERANGDSNALSIVMEWIGMEE